MRTIPLTEARANLNKLVESLGDTDDEIALTKHGRTVAYVRSAEAAERAEATAFWLAQPGILDDVAASRAGDAETFSLDVVRQDIRARAEREGITL